MPELRWGAATNPGLVRTENEDTFVAEPMVFAVADGMGGHQAGEVASALAASILRDRLGAGASSEDAAVAAVTEANAAIYGAARANAAQTGMGTTLTALAVLASEADGEPEQLVLLNVGDSRTYRFRGGRLQRVTVDHSYVQELVATGHITMEEARTHPRRNIVTRALGIEPSVRTDMWTLPIVRGDRFVLCSDGLVDEVPDDEIIDLVMSITDPQPLAEALVARANSHGGRDNVTVIIVDVLEGVDPPDPTDEIAFDPTWADSSAGTHVWAADAGDAADAAPVGAMFAGEVGPAAATTAITLSDPTTGDAAPGAALDAMALPTLPPPALPTLPTLPSSSTPRSSAAPTTPPGPMPPPPTEQDMGIGLTTVSPSVDDMAATTAMPGAKLAAAEAAAAAAANVGGVKVHSAAAATPARPKKRRFGVGAFLFVFILTAIVVATLTLIAVHARSGYFVGFKGDTVVIYKGQKDDILWFKPTVERTSTKTKADLDPTVVAIVNRRPEFSSPEGAAQFIDQTVTATTVPTSDLATTTTTTVAETTTTVAGAATTTIVSGP